MDADELMMLALDAGAEDFAEEDESFEILTAPEDFSEVRLKLEEAGVIMADAEVTMIPQTYVELTGEEDIKISRKHWICWKKMTMSRMYTTTGANRRRKYDSGYSQRRYDRII